MLFKKVYLLSLCVALAQMSVSMPSFAVDKQVVVSDSQTGVKPIIRFDNDTIVNINLSNAAVGDVLKALADQVGYNLIINTESKAVDDVIPRIEFNNIKLSEAMSFILKIKNLTVRKINKTLFISDQAQMSKSGIDDSMIKVYKISNVKPSEAVTKIAEFYVDSKPPKLIPDDFTNTISAIARPTEIDYLESILSVVDAPIPQVMIEIKLIELSEDTSKLLGFSYGLGQKQFGIGFNNTNIPVQDSGGAPITSSALQLSFSALQNFTANFNAQINMLAANGKAKILSNPRIATQNGKKAMFQATESAPIIQTSATATGTSQTVTTIEIGETINVTPTLVDPASGFVTLDLAPEISSRGKDVIVNGNPVPERLTRKITTLMKVRSGESIVIGGLKRKNNTTSSNKIPILGDIPFLGTLFGTNSWSDSESEIIIMVTPYILDEGGNAAKN